MYRSLSSFTRPEAFGHFENSLPQLPWFLWPTPYQLSHRQVASHTVGDHLKTGNCIKNRIIYMGWVEPGSTRYQRNYKKDKVMIMIRTTSNDPILSKMCMQFQKIWIWIPQITWVKLSDTSFSATPDVSMAGTLDSPSRAVPDVASSGDWLFGSSWYIHLGAA